MKFKQCAVVLGAAAFAAAVVAAVTFDPATGKGFVGKGDVQTAFGWSNAQLQSNAKNVGFTFSQHEQYTGTCTFTVETGGVRNRQTKSVTSTRVKNVNVSGDVGYDVRVRNQITGYNLTGYQNNLTVIGVALQNGDPCEGGNVGDGIISDVVQTGYQAALNAVYNGTSVRLAWPPAPI
ncbi:hypothetical protein [Azohydromonas australica]|uniref:hypothetical protein n=1 Tax=Azohydromonas australica TaxID=364039 RepID=UPI00040B190C|nr:hypothetical protein [Azohydromonas australica]